MAKVIDYSPDDRAIREQQAANQLTGSLGRKPSQEEIYQQAYGTPYVVFSSDFGLPRMEKQVGKYVKNVYKAGGRIRKGIVNPEREARYRKNVGEVFADQDPLSQQNMVDQIVGNRTAGINNNVNQRFRQYSQQRANDVFDYLKGNQKLQNALEGIQGQENAQADFQNNLALYEAKKQIDRAYPAPRSGGGGILGNSDKLLMLGMGLDPNKPEDIVSYASLKAENSFTEDDPSLGSAADIQQARQTLAESMAQFPDTTVDQWTTDLQTQGYDPEDFADILLNAPGAEEDNGGGLGGAWDTFKGWFGF